MQPLGFSLRDKQLQCAGLDYHGLVEVVQHNDWCACRGYFAGRRLFAVTTRGERCYDEPRYRGNDVFVFGPETHGLPDRVIAEFAPEQRIRVPMRETSRSLNLSNTVALVIYEAWRQLGFRGSA